MTLESYGGAVKQCSCLCHTHPEEFKSKTCTNCSGGWVDVPTIFCTYGCRCGEWTDHDRPRVTAPWAYPQPGDSVLTGGNTLAQLASHDLDGIYEIMDEGTHNSYVAHPTDLRLIVDRPNPNRIPGTEAPP